MKKSIEVIEEGIQDTFPEMDNHPITMEMKFGDIIGWDSMSAVNLQMFLEEHLGVEFSADLFSQENNLSEIVKFIQENT